MREAAFRVPYVFAVTGIPKRGSKERTVHCFDYVEARVPVLDAEDAPVAVEFPTPFNEMRYPGEGGTTRLRHYGGRLYCKVLHTSYDKRTLDVTPAMLAAFLEGGRDAVEDPARLDDILPTAHDILQRGLFPPEVDHNPIRPFREDQWSTWSPGRRDEARAKAVARLEGLAVIDGRFWSVVPEPVYHLSHLRAEPHRGWDAGLVVTIDPLDFALGRYPRQEIYGLNDWDRMMETSARYGLEPDGQKRALVHIEEAFTYSQSHERMIQAFSEALVHDGDMLKSFDKPSMLAWADFRDAMQAAREGDFAEGVLDTLASAAEAYAACRASSKRARDEIATALEIIDNRTLDTRSLVGGGPSPS